MIARRAAVLSALLLAGVARAGDAPPWASARDVPLPTWARSVVPKHGETPIVAAPGKPDAKRGTTLRGVRLPLFAARRGPSCAGRWLEVGPSAWVCGAAADLSPEEPMPASSGVPAGTLPYRYFFVGKNGADGFLDLARAQDDAPDEQLDPGFAVAVDQERAAFGEVWGHTHHGPWVALRELGAARPSAFRGEQRGDLDFAWVIPERARVWASMNRSKPQDSKVRREVVPWREERATRGGVMVRISDDGVTPTLWMAARDLAHPELTAPPAEVTGPHERWVDVDIARQTLVAYEGKTPVYATLVSTGRGAPGTASATRPGVFRIWVKLTASTMDNLGSSSDADTTDEDDPDHRYSLEDVPYVQFFDKDIALHGVFWHDAFGRKKSHGCVNLAPADASWLFGFTAPHLPAGWSAVLPYPGEPGTVVRVRGPSARVR